MLSQEKLVKADQRRLETTSAREKNGPSAAKQQNIEPGVDAPS